LWSYRDRPSLFRYISCFRHPARAAGEGAYYFVHFVSAVSFIENLNPSLLNMDPADFELYASPRAVCLQSN
jgi:hypothetical protein